MTKDNQTTILETVKFYKPSKGGMETVVETIVDSVCSLSENYRFLVYSNTHTQSFVGTAFEESRNMIIKESTPFLFKNQPLSLFYLSLMKLINESNIIHHHYPFPTMEIALLRNRNLIKNKKLIITWHANIQQSRWKSISGLYDPIANRLLKMASCIVVSSPQLIDNSFLLKRYIDKVKVIPLSYDSKFVNINQQPRTIDPDAVKRILFVGKLREYKGVKYLIEAVKGLDKIELIIVGSGEQEAELKKQVEDNNMKSQVQFVKNADDTQLRDLYQICDLFVLPSINEAEAFGVVQLEAMANGLPVINTKLNSGASFVSLDKVTGFTVPPCNSILLKNSILEILNDPILYNFFSTNCLERIKLFDSTRFANEYLKLYE